MMLANAKGPAILFALCAAGAGGSGCDSSDRHHLKEQAQQQAKDLADRTRAAADNVAGDVKSGVGQIKADAQQAGQDLKNSKLGEDMRETVKDSGSSVRQALDDTAITARVKAALLADKNVMSSRITVETFHGKVMLSGQLPDRSQVDRAVEIASHTEGVAAVENHLSAG